MRCEVRPTRIIPVLILLLAFAGPACGQLLPVPAWTGCEKGGEAMPPTARVRSGLGEIYRVLLGRPLTTQELERVTAEFLRALDKQCPSGILNWNMRLGQVVKTQPGTPQALIVRHYLIAALYFSPQQHGTLGQRLVATPDPIRVVDSKTKYLMTERDLIAFCHLQLLAQSGRLPSPQTFSRAQLDRVAALLNGMYGDGKNSQQWAMPPLWGYAAAFWLGLQREWPKLTAQEREAVRAFIQAPVDTKKRLDAGLLQRVLGVGGAYQRQYAFDALQANMHNVAMAAVAGAGAYASTMATINGILRP